MKLQTKFFLMLFSLSVLLGTGIIVPGYLKIRSFESTEADNYLRDSLTQLNQELARSIRTLQTAGVTEIESYVESGKEKFLLQISGQQDAKRSGTVVLDQNDEVILAKGIRDPGETIRFIARHAVSAGPSQSAIEVDGAVWRVAIDRDDSWDWTIVRAMRERDVYKESSAYLSLVLSIGSLVLILVLAAYYLLTSQINRRFNAIFDHLELFKRGQYDGVIDTRRSDEIGVLARGINDMMTSISDEIAIRKDTERELAAAKSEAETANRAKSQFLANASHEIRNPLNSILGFSELLSNTALDPEQTRYVKYLTHASRGLTSTIDDILDLTKIEFGVIELDPESFNFREEVRSTFGLFALAGKNKGLDMTCEISADVPESVYYDRARLLEVVSNLVGNAVKYTDEGQVQLVADVERDASQAALLRIDVIDSGIGINLDEKSEIFNPFKRADAVIKNHQVRRDGSGLGLPIVQRLVTLMEGSISVHSTPGEGSTFTVTIPLTVPEGKTQEPVAAQKSPIVDVAGLRVLVADDEPLNLTYVGEVLRKNKIKAVLVEDGREVVDALDVDEFDMILLDIRMPRMSGVEVMKFVRNELPAPVCNIPIVALTANAYEEDIEEYFAAGASAFLAKPYRSEDLIKTIQQLAGQAAYKPAQASV